MIQRLRIAQLASRNVARQCIDMTVAMALAPIGVSVGRTVFGVVLVGALIGFAVVCAMKGKWVFFVLGFFSGVFWIVGALRLGKPKSHWAMRRYGDLRIVEAERRFS
jgi:hypothetical protein